MVAGALYAVTIITMQGVQGVPLPNKPDFQTFRPQFEGSEIAAAHCHLLLKTPVDANCNLRNLTCATSVTDVIAEMFDQNMCRVCGKDHTKNKLYNAKYGKNMLCKIY